MHIFDAISLARLFEEIFYSASWFIERFPSKREISASPRDSHQVRALVQQLMPDVPPSPLLNPDLSLIF